MSEIPKHQIRDAADHAAVMARINILAANNLLPGTAADDELNILSQLVRSYEDIHFPLGPISKEEALAFRAEQMGLNGK